MRLVADGWMIETCASAAVVRSWHRSCSPSPLAEVLVAIAAGIASDRGWSFLLNHFVVTNAVIGGSLAVAGWPIAWQRPRNPIGWLLLAGGVCYAGSAAAFSLLAWGSYAGDERPFWRLIATWANLSWPWAITCCVPMILLLFPTGRFLSRRWRWTVPMRGDQRDLVRGDQPCFLETTSPRTSASRAYLVWTRFETLSGWGRLLKCWATLSTARQRCR